MNVFIWWIDFIFNVTLIVAFIVWYNLICEDCKEWNVYMIWVFVVFLVY